MLPTLQSSTTSTHPLYSGSQHTLRTETTDTLDSAYELSHSYNHSSQTAARHDMDWSAQDNCAPHTSYGASQPMMPSATTAASPPQLIATTPAAGRRLRVLRPKAPGGPMEHRDVGPHGPVPPSSVFGSRGRRGMLPLAPDRPAAPAIGILAAENIFIPIKNTEGRFPCPHCTKDYMHAKHLKRHLLRHTGYRPYMCFLYHHTFSRSDILKRHFQKCSIHRGNPTGASHLSRPEAHVKKNAQAQKAQGMPNGDIVNTMPEDGMLHPFGMVLAQDGCGIVPSVTNGSQPCGGDVNPMDRLNMHPSHPGWYARTYWNCKPPQSSLGWAQAVSHGAAAHNYS